MERSKALEILEKFVGNWKVDIKFTMPDGNVLKGKGTWSFKSICNGLGVYMVLNADVSGLGKYEEHDLVGYSEEGKVHVFSITTTGAVHDHAGTFKDDKTIEIVWKGLAEGKETVEAVTGTIISPNEIRFKEVDTVEGKPSLIGDYVLKK